MDVLAKFCLESKDVPAKFHLESVDVLANSHLESLGVPAKLHLECPDSWMRYFIYMYDMLVSGIQLYCVLTKCVLPKSNGCG